MEITTPIGIIEGFYGPVWPTPMRHEWAKLLKELHADFYIYAPKKDPSFRKKWQEQIPPDEFQELLNLKTLFNKSGVKFGVGLSPFELYKDFSEENKAHLSNKLAQIDQLGVDILGLFFDDMKSTPDLAQVQIEIVHFIKDKTKAKILFCPTFYTTDPLLERLFGEKPQNYLEDLGAGLHPDIEILWTGPKVISPDIPAEHLKEITALLKRKPFLWDNFFANDGPKQCHFLKVKPLEGRNYKALLETSGWGFNLMNQPLLSMLVFKASLKVLKENEDPKLALFSTLKALQPNILANLLATYGQDFTLYGREDLETSVEREIRTTLQSLNDPLSNEIKDWLNGAYEVDHECLTD